MDTPDGKIGRLADRVSSELLALYNTLLRQNLINAGVDGAVFDDVSHTTMLELQVQQASSGIVNQVLRSEEDRGIDSIGRIVTEFCFVKTPTGSMLWPEFSDKDTMARWQFELGVLPRPLLRYFLISVRGSIDNLDGFSAPSFLFSDSPGTIETLRRDISLLLDEFKGPFGTGDSAVDWEDVYQDKRVRKLANDLIKKMNRRIANTGMESYLDTLVGYHDADPNKNKGNLMQRSISIEDVRQIKTALEQAETQLRKDA